MNRSVSANRLNKLADYLEQLPARAIRMDAWLSDMQSHRHMKRWGGFNGFRFETTLKRVRGIVQSTITPTGSYSYDGQVVVDTTPERAMECGFAACAVGWACTIPSFKRAGLKMVMVDAVGESGDVNHTVTPDILFGTNNGFDAVAEFFGLTFNETVYLFGGEAYGYSARPRPSTVSRRIRKFIEKRAAGGQTVPYRFRREHFLGDQP